jgi:hypothetical protein
MLKQRVLFLQKNRCTNIFSHPDYTVGSGVTPDQQRVYIDVMSSLNQPDTRGHFPLAPRHKNRVFGQELSTCRV